MNPENQQRIREMIESGEFNGYTLVSGEDWQLPTARETTFVRGLILTDIQLANRRMWTNVPSASEIRPDPDGVHHMVLPVLAGRAGDAAG
jgi:hypothetical protein